MENNSLEPESATPVLAPVSYAHVRYECVWAYGSRHFFGHLDRRPTKGAFSAITFYRRAKIAVLNRYQKEATETAVTARQDVGERLSSSALGGRRFR